jgi:hypothetical protein
MPTNVIRTNAPITTGGSVWEGIGGGLQGLGQLAAAYYGAQSADKAKGQAALQEVGVDERGFKPGQNPLDSLQTAPIATSLSPASLASVSSGMPRASTSVNVNAAAPPIQLATPQLASNPWSPGGSQFGAPMTGGGGAGFQSLFATQFPSLFPQSASQYGGF